MNRFVKKTDVPFPNNVADALNKSVIAGTFHDDLKTATAFVETELEKRKGNLPPLGLAAPILTSWQIKERMDCGTFGFLICMVQGQTLRQC